MKVPVTDSLYLRLTSSALEPADAMQNPMNKILCVQGLHKILRLLLLAGLQGCFRLTLAEGLTDKKM